jgi:hypothetical protein
MRAVPAQDPSISSVNLLGSNVIWSKVAEQPSPAGDWAKKPYAGAPEAYRAKWRISRQYRPSSEA